MVLAIPVLVPPAFLLVPLSNPFTEEYFKLRDEFLLSSRLGSVSWKRCPIVVDH